MGQIYTIYLIEDHRNKPYVGVTSKKPSERLEEHKRTAKFGRESHLYNAMRKYGYDKFSVVTLECTKGAERAFKLERKWIKSIGSYEDWGYNMTSGGRGEAKYGEDAPNTHLSRKEAQEIKWLAQEMDTQNKMIAEHYDVVPSTVTTIKKGTNWPSIEPNKPEKIPQKFKRPPVRGNTATIKRIQQIKWLACNSTLSYSDIAERFDTTRKRVGKIKRETIWADVNASKPFDKATSLP